MLPGLASLLPSLWHSLNIHMQHGTQFGLDMEPCAFSLAGFLRWGPYAGRGTPGRLLVLDALLTCLPSPKPFMFKGTAYSTCTRYHHAPFPHTPHHYTMPFLHTHFPYPFTHTCPSTF